VPEETSGRDQTSTTPNDICVIIERVTEVPQSEIKGNISLDDVGIDSMMMIEVVSEIPSQFSLDLPINYLESLTNVDSLAQSLNKHLGDRPSVSSTSQFAAKSRCSSDPAASPPNSISPAPGTLGALNPLDALPKLAAWPKSIMDLSGLPGLEAICFS
jgi:acyl carrier protein